jgi:hypothetical protein
MTIRGMIGQRFGRWVVEAAAGSHQNPCGSKVRMWHCRCDCGTERAVRQVHLRTGKSRSCGCWQAERTSAVKTTHGGRQSRLYEVWTQMLQRCGNPRNKRYARYGGRGIAVSERWRDFAMFRADMEPSYQSGLSLDRINNDGNYEPSNCRWADALTQARNKGSRLARA